MSEVVSYRLYPRRELRLLCLLVRGRCGQRWALPIHTLHLRAPFAGPSGYYAEARRAGSVALDISQLPHGPGLILRHVPTWRPRPGVLARCLRQRDDFILRGYPRAV